MLMNTKLYKTKKVKLVFISILCAITVLLLLYYHPGKKEAEQ